MSKEESNLNPFTAGLEEIRNSWAWFLYSGNSADDSGGHLHCG